MIHPCTTSVTRVITALKAAQFSGAAQQLVPLVPGAFFLWSEDRGVVDLEAASAPGNALLMRAVVAEAPDWVTLHVQMGPGQFAPGDVIGLIYDLRCDIEVDCTISIQSWQNGQYQETEFQEPLCCGPRRETRTAMHTVSEVDGLPYAQEFHTLILRLPLQNFELELFNLRFFFLPASQGLKTRGPTLASVAG